MIRSLIPAAVAFALGAAAPLPALATTVTPTPCDFVTGGGYVFKDDGAMANYGIHAGCKNGEFWGHINYVDHGLGLHVRSTEITMYVRETLADGTTLENTRTDRRARDTRRASHTAAIWTSSTIDLCHGSLSVTDST